MTTVKHYGDEWAAANYREMVARRYHVISTYTGSCMCSSHAAAEATDMMDDLINSTGGSFAVIDTQSPRLRPTNAHAGQCVSLTS